MTAVLGITTSAHAYGIRPVNGATYPLGVYLTADDCVTRHKISQTRATETDVLYETPNGPADNPWVTRFQVTLQGG